MNEDYIKKIYDYLIKSLFNSFDEEHKKNIIDNYFKYLSIMYLDIINEFKEKDKVVEMIERNEIKKWADKSYEYIMSSIYEDDVLKDINYFAKKAEKAALSRIDNGIIMSEEKANNDLEFINKLIESVQPFNKGLAANTISRAMQNYMFASNQAQIASEDIEIIRRNKE